jgi:hypothetical protein
MGNVRPEFVRMLEESFAKTISFEVTLENLAAVIDADRTPLNLCINARKAMVDAGEDHHTPDRVAGILPRERFLEAAEPFYERIRRADAGRGMDRPSSGFF